jgi:hypothetical protein
LIGLFGLSKVKGPTIMTVVLLIVAMVYNHLMNRYFAPLEGYLPTDLAEQLVDESTGLLSAAEEGEHHSRIRRLGQQAHVPARIADPLGRFFEPHVFASYGAMRAWLREDDGYRADDDRSADDVAQDEEYSTDELAGAYLNPALTSKTPLLWLPRDRVGATAHEVRESEEAGLKVSDRGAWIDERGRVEWAKDDFEEVPV